MNHLDLFSGIGGFALAVDTVWPGSTHIFVDNDLFCQAVLKKHWPNSTIYGDIRQFITDTDNARLQTSGAEQQATRARGEDTFILTGGFPCQPFSQAGRRQGTADDRFLWPEMFRVIQLTQPTWVIAENVRGLLTINGSVVFEQVCADLESEGYEVQPLIIPAVAVNAPHRRDRIWFIANRVGERLEGQGSESELQKPAKTVRQASDAANASSPRSTSRLSRQNNRKEGDTGIPDNGSEKRDWWKRNWIEVATRLCTLDDGLPNGLVRPKGWRNAALKAAGNAIVPQVAIEIMRAIKLSTPPPPHH